VAADGPAGAAGGWRGAGRSAGFAVAANQLIERLATLVDTSPGLRALATRSSRRSSTARCRTSSCGSNRTRRRRHRDRSGGRRVRAIRPVARVAVRPGPPSARRDDCGQRRERVPRRTGQGALRARPERRRRGCRHRRRPLRHHGSAPHCAARGAVPEMVHVVVRDDDDARSVGISQLAGCRWVGSARGRARPASAYSRRTGLDPARTSRPTSAGRRRRSRRSRKAASMRSSRWSPRRGTRSRAAAVTAAAAPLDAIAVERTVAEVHGLLPSRSGANLSGPGGRRADGCRHRAPLVNAAVPEAVVRDLLEVLYAGGDSRAAACARPGCPGAGALRRHAAAARGRRGVLRAAPSGPRRRDPRRAVRNGAGARGGHSTRMGADKAFVQLAVGDDRARARRRAPRRMPCS